MRVRYVMPAWLPAASYGGPIAKLQRLLPALKALGVHPEIVTTTLAAPGRATLPAGRDESAPTPVLRLHCRFARRWSAWVEWPDGLPPVDVVHVVGAWTGIAYQGLRAGFADDTPTFWEPAGMLPATGNRRLIKRVLTPWHRRLARRVDGLILTSPREAEELPFDRADCPIRLRPNPAPTRPESLPGRAEARTALGLPDAGTIWGYLGRLHPRKGLRDVLDAWQHARSSDLLAFAGPAEDVAIVAAIDRAGPTVRRLPALDEAARWTFLRAIDALVLLPEFGENFGNVVVEAALAGTPVLASAAVGALTYFTDPGVRRVDVGDLARAFRERDVPPSPGPLPEALTPASVAVRQLDIYRQRLAA